MKYFNILVEGSGFLLMLDGEAEKVGFFTTVGVSAMTALEASTQARLLMKERLRESHLKGYSRPFCEICKITRLENELDLALAGGFSFYPSDATQLFFRRIRKIYLSIFRPSRLIEIDI